MFLQLFKKNVKDFIIRVIFRKKVKILYDVIWPTKYPSNHSNCISVNYYKV